MARTLSILKPQGAPRSKWFLMDTLLHFLRKWFNDYSFLCKAQVVSTSATFLRPLSHDLNGIRIFVPLVGLLLHVQKCTHLSVTMCRYCRYCSMDKERLSKAKHRQECASVRPICPTVLMCSARCFCVVPPISLFAYVGKFVLRQSAFDDMFWLRPKARQERRRLTMHHRSASQQTSNCTLHELAKKTGRLAPSSNKISINTYEYRYHCYPCEQWKLVYNNFMSQIIYVQNKQHLCFCWFWSRLWFLFCQVFSAALAGRSPTSGIPRSGAKGRDKDLVLGIGLNIWNDMGSLLRLGL